MDNEMNEADFVAAIYDETTDEGKKSQLSKVYRLCTKNGEVKERFRGFIDVSKDKTAKGLYEKIKRELETN
jgi:hypothetical protein